MPLSNLPLSGNLLPRQDQVEDFLYLKSLKRSASFSEVGTGKSLVSFLWVLDRLLANKAVLVVMPAALVDQYVINFKAFAAPNYQSLIGTLDKGPAAREYAYRHNLLPRVLVISYQILVKDVNALARRFQALVLDEAQAIQFIKSRAYAAVYRLVECEDYDFLELAATPYTSQLAGAYSHISLKTPEAYSSFREFEHRHIVYDPYSKYKSITGYTDTERIAEYLNKFSVRRRQSEVLSLEVPNMIEQTIALSKPHKALYRELLRMRFLEMKDRVLLAANQQALRQMALQLVTQVEHFTDKPIEDKPLDTLKAILDSICLEKNKAVVFCWFVATVHKLKEAFKEHDPACIYSGENITMQKAKFIDNPSCRLAIINMAAGGVGLDGLQHVSNNAIFYEIIGSPAALKQCIGRIQRGGQKLPCNFWFFRYVGTLSEKLLDSAIERSILESEVMRDKESLMKLLQII